MPGQGAVTTTGDSATGASGVRDGRGRIERYDPTTIEPRWQARWDELGLYETDLDDGSQPPLLPADDVRLPVGLAAHRALVREDADRRDRPLPPDARRQRVPCRWASMRSGCPPRTRRSRTASTRASGRWRTSTRCAASCGRWAPRWDWSAEVVTCDPEYYRWNQWLFLQFLEAGLAYRAVSPVDWCPNDGTLAREQVEGADRHCWRCGAKVEKRELRAVVPADDRLRRRAAGLLRHRLARPDPDHADQLDRPLHGRRDRVRDRAIAAPRGRRGAARVHDAARHAVRGHVHGARAGAPAGGDADGAGAAGRGRGVRRWPPRRRPRSTGCRPTGRRPAWPSARTRSTRSTASGSRSSSPTTCSAATAPARSWPSRPTTSATSSSPSSSGCRSSTS